MNEEYYLDWLTDNSEFLKDEFIDEHQDEFDEFCKKCFNNWEE